MAVVTGGLGFIGSHLVDLLADHEDVTIIDDYRWRPDGADLPAYAADWSNRVEILIRSIADAEPLGADVIYHLAGPVGPVGLLSSAGQIADEIVCDAKRMATLAHRRGATLVYVSTSEIYGPQPCPIAEDAPRIIPAGHSARMEYAAAKLAAETLLLNSSADVRIVRPFNVAGPRQREEGGFVVPRFINQAKAGEPLTVYGDGSGRRAFTHVLDIVEGIQAALTHGQSGGVYNLGNPDNECSILELAREVVAELDSESPIDFVDPRNLWGPTFVDAPDKVPAVGKAVVELGWVPYRDRRSVIRDAAGLRELVAA